LCYCLNLITSLTILMCVQNLLSPIPSTLTVFWFLGFQRPTQGWESQQSFHPAFPNNLIQLKNTNNSIRQIPGDRAVQFQFRFRLGLWCLLPLSIILIVEETLQCWPKNKGRINNKSKLQIWKKLIFNEMMIRFAFF
jgi:hypothetical protein